MSTQKQWGGCRAGAGRKPDSEPRIYVRIRLTKAQHEKLKALGGSKWVAVQLDNIKI